MSTLDLSTDLISLVSLEISQSLNKEPNGRSPLERERGVSEAHLRINQGITLENFQFIMGP